MLLSAENLSINFGSRQLLSNVNFYLNDGDKVGIIGINGTGKSTFLKVLSGVLEADEGRITRNPNVQISYLSQNPVMDDNATVLEQVFLHFAAITMIPVLFPKPSISTRSWLRVCSRSSCPPPRPAPL